MKKIVLAVMAATVLSAAALAPLAASATPNGPKGLSNGPMKDSGHGPKGNGGKFHGNKFGHGKFIGGFGAKIVIGGGLDCPRVPVAVLTKKGTVIQFVETCDVVF
jgi:hypothetical protein